jgi:elongation factor P--(R)-beta-lysine ligase
MTDWRPSGTLAAAQERARLLRRVREYFAAHDVLEVDTPAIGTATVTDPHIASIPAGSGGWLQSSPEYHMKRLLAAGYPDIYSIARVFRDGEYGTRHLPEFTMVEWYRLGFDLAAIVDDAIELIRAVLDRPLPLHDVLDYRDAVLAATGLDPLTAGADTLAEAAGADPALRTSLGDDRDAWLDLLVATRVVDSFRPDGMTVVRHFPASQAALARLCPADRRVADRFEIYLGACELANGYVELTDAREQSARMDRDLVERRRRGLPPVPRDARLLAALEAGLPACAGVALGFERLHMLAAGLDDIKNVVPFPGDTL